MTDSQTHPARKVMAMIRRLGYALLGLTILMGAVYQAIGAARDRRKYPPLGKRVDVGSHRLHINCMGEGSPTVIMESGLGGSSLDWSLVQPRVAKFTRVCTYDRAGFGWSDPGPKPRTSQQIVKELHMLLVNADIEGPYVLVGHSLGGLHVRLYATQYPDDVVGMVLVDASHEDQRARIPQRPLRTRVVEGMRWQWFRLNPIFARLGLLRLRNRPNGVSAPLPPEVKPAAVAIGLQSRAYDWIYNWGATIEESEAQIRVAGSLPDIPLAVLSAGTNYPTDELKKFWMELQTELAGLSPNSTHIIAEESGHFIQLDQAELVIDAVRRVVEAARHQKKLSNKTVYAN